MKHDLLKKHIESFMAKCEKGTLKQEYSLDTRQERKAYYQSWTKDRILQMTQDDFYEYISKLWAMLFWGNKRYKIDRVIQDNGFEHLKSQLTSFVWGSDDIESRWNGFRRRVKGFGPAMMSEILCNTHPTEHIIWSRRVYVALDYLGVEKLPRYNYQLDGQMYLRLTDICKSVGDEIVKAGMEKEKVDFLLIDNFFWEELQVQEKLSQIHKSKTEVPKKLIKEDTETSIFIHNEVRDKLADIGEWLGFKTKTETKIAEGSQVDTIWEATIGNMGRVIYVFEVQTRGSIDSLIVNLLKSLNNSAVQGVVAVSDLKQLELIKKHASGVTGLADRLRYWDYEEVLQVHEQLESVNQTINSLGLVPQGF